MPAETESSSQQKSIKETEKNHDRVVTVGELSATISHSSLLELIIDEKTALKSIAELLTKLQEKTFTNATLPAPIREGKEPIENSSHLAKALIPANNKYLAENLTNFTKAQLARIAKKSLAQELPINISIDLPSFNIADAQQNDDLQPNFFDYLFLEQIKNYLQILRSYPHGVNLTFTFDNNGEAWVFDNILNPSKISETQSTHVKRISELIHKLFPREDFPDLSIEINSKDEPETAELDESLDHYRKIEEVIIEKSIAYFEEIKERKRSVYSWIDLFRQTQDPHYGHTMFYDMQRKFIIKYIDELDPDKEYELFRPTPKEISSIIQTIQSKIEERFYEGGSESGVPTSGYMHYDTIKEIARRFIARELLLNKQRLKNQDIIHVVPGDPSIYKQLFRRRVIALKPSGTDEIAHPQFSKPKISLSPSDIGVSVFRPIKGSERSDDPQLIIKTPHGEYEIPISRY